MALQHMNIYLDKDKVKTAETLRLRVRVTEELEFFSNHCGSKQAWYRYIFQRGLTQIFKDLERWEKMHKLEEIKDKENNK